MTLHQSIKSKKSLSRGILLIAFLLGVFSYSGLSVYHSSQKQVPQTEQVASVEKRAAKRSHSFTIAVVSLVKKCSVPLNASQIALTTLIQSRLVKVKLIDASRKIRLFERPIAHFKSAPVPHSSDEDPIHSVRG
jgi:hypothetical protein